MAVGVVMPVVPMPVHEVIDDADLCIWKSVFLVCRLVELDATGKVNLVSGR